MNDEQLPLLPYDDEKKSCRNLFWETTRDRFPVTVDKDTQYLYHYTSVPGFQGIVSNCCMHASNFAYLNDASEIGYGKDLLRSVIAESGYQVSGKFMPFVQKCVSKIQERISASSFHAYGCCFSDLHDDLNQWRGYGQGICVGFDRQKLSQGFFSFARLEKVIYDPETSKWIIDQMLQIYLNKMIEHQERPDVENLCGSLIDDFQIMMELALPAFKHPSFRAEKEWRLLRFRAIGHSPKSDPVIDFRLRGDMPVPYLKLEPSNGDLLPITSVRIGPSDRMREHVAFSVSCILEKYGYMGIPLFHSQIPFRPT